MTYWFDRIAILIGAAAGAFFAVVFFTDRC